MANSVGLNAQSGCVQRVVIVGDETPDFVPQCFTDDSGTVFFGLWQLDGDELVMQFFTVAADGTTTPYEPTSTPVPCAPNDVEPDHDCWRATADGDGYSVDDELRQWFFWDVTTTPPTLIGVSWYNQTTGATIPAAPPQADLVSCRANSAIPVTGHIKECIIADRTTEINAEATFGALNPLISSLVTDAETERILREAIGDALELQREEEAKGFPVTSFIINTDSGNVFSFSPSALIRNVVTGLMSFTTADVITWPQPLTDDITTIEYTVLTECECRQVELIQRINADDSVTLISVVNPRVVDAQGNKEVIALPLPIGTVGPLPGPCPLVDDDRNEPVIGYLRTCDSFDIVLPINSPANFSDNLAATTTITAAAGIAQLLISQLERAQEYQAAEEASGIAVTNFIINTDGGSVFEFPPSAWLGGTTLEFTTADLVAWPGPLTDDITTIEYSVLDNCGCEAVEMHQEFRGDDLVLLNMYRPHVFDPVTRVKERVQIPLVFGVTGPFAGPCPPDEQVLELDDLCCNDDLANNSPDIAQQRLAWLDGADPERMLDAVGGVPIIGNDGDQVFEVQDKLDPGVAASFVVPTAIAPGDTAPINPPTYQSNQFNGLSALQFNAANRERIRLNTNNAPGNAFTFFYLFSATVSGNGHQCILSVGPNNGDGDAYNVNDGSWQFSRDALLDSFVIRVETGDVAPTIIFQRTVGAGDGTVGGEDDRTIVPLNQAYDGQLHLLTATYDNVTNIASVFFDGEIQLILDYTPAPAATANFASDYFRVFGNRDGSAFSDGRLAELFFANSLLTEDEIATVNAYLICKWGIDPSLAAGGAGDLTLGPDGIYDASSPFRRVLKASGEVVYLNTNNGLEFPVPPVPGLAVCTGAADGCCTHDGLETEDFALANPDVLNIPANTAHSLSVYVATGTADINGVTFPAGAIRNVNGDDGQNNIGIAQDIDNITGNTLVTVTRYVL